MNFLFLLYSHCRLHLIVFQVMALKVVVKSLLSFWKLCTDISFRLRQTSRCLHVAFSFTFTRALFSSFKVFCNKSTAQLRLALLVQRVSCQTFIKHISLSFVTNHKLIRWPFAWNSHSISIHHYRIRKWKDNRKNSNWSICLVLWCFDGRRFDGSATSIKSMNE